MATSNNAKKSKMSRQRLRESASVMVMVISLTEVAHDHYVVDCDIARGKLDACKIKQNAARL